MRRSLYATQWLHPWMQVLCVFGVCDDHYGPLLKPQVRETEQVMVKGQDPVSGQHKAMAVRQKVDDDN